MDRLSWNKNLKQAIFCKKSRSLLGYAEYYLLIRFPEHYDIIDVTKPFKAHLTYTGCGRGRSAIHFYFEDLETRIKYQMFLTDMDDVISRGLAPLSLRGTWEVVKRGSNYGVRMVEAAE
jgi:hypothetical protein